MTAPSITAAEESVQAKLAADRAGLRFRCAETEADYQRWRVDAVMPYMRLGIITAAISAVSAVPFAPLAAPGQFRQILLLILLGILPLILLAMIATFVRGLRGSVMYLAPMANCVAGLIAVWLVHDMLRSPGVSAGVVVMAIFFAFAIFRFSPLMAGLTVMPYIVFDLLLLTRDFREHRVTQMEYWTTLFLPLIASMIGLVVCAVLEHITRASYRSECIIAQQRQALLEERAQLCRFLAPEVTHLVREHGIEATLIQQTLVLSVVCIDLRGFTAYTQRHGAKQMGLVLHQYYDIIIEVAKRYGGTVKDFAGDGGLILLGAPLRRDDHARAGLSLARDLVQAVGVLVRRLACAETPLGVGAAVATGECAVGAIGSQSRLEYTAVGSAVNLAARLCSRAADGEILICPYTAQLLVGDCGWRIEQMQLKGFHEPIAVAIESQYAAQPL